MIVEVVDEFHVLAVWLEDEPPVAADFDRKISAKIAFERVQSEARNIHVVSRFCDVEQRQDEAQFRRVGWLDAGLASRFVEALKAFVLERDDHSVRMVSLYVHANVFGLDSRLHGNDRAYRERRCERTTLTPTLSRLRERGPT